MILLIASIVIIILYLTVVILQCVLGKLVFRPTQTSMKEFNNLGNMFGDKIEMFTVKTKDDEKITCCLFNSFRKPSFDDILFLYSHGNSGSIASHMQGNLMNFMSKIGSVIIYDYRGFGASSGSPSESGLYIDIETVWDYLTIQKNVSQDKIILVGMSLGTSISSYLASKLVDKNIYPKGLLLNCPFSSVDDMVVHHVPILSILSMFTLSGLDNLRNLIEIDGKIPVIVAHSKNDEIIPFQQSVKLKNNSKCHFVEIGGFHNSPVYPKKFDDNVKKYFSVELS